MMGPDEQRFPWHLDWNLLRTFMVVVEQRGISRAGDFLSLKQPTISSALKRLEETMGHQLIVRKPNEFKVTRAGQRLYAECSSIFGTVSQLPSLLQEDASELRGHISIMSASHVVSDHFDEVLSRFSEAHPRVSFSITVANSDEVVSRVSQNRVSFGMCLLHREPADLRTQILFREYFGLFCGPRHRLFGRDDVSLADLEGEPAVSFQTETEGGPLEPVTRLRLRAKMSTHWSGMSANLMETRRMIVANIGIGALPLHVARRDVDLGMLRQLPPDEGLPRINIYLLSNPRRKLSEAEAAFHEMLNAMLEDVPLEDRTYT
ncbi:LysR family transcriptional regulator [Pseudooceanicola marinus]|nr:LysR family transcriptional regulator [Pseudooceanicola marinus]